MQRYLISTATIFGLICVFLGRGVRGDAEVQVGFYNKVMVKDDKAYVCVMSGRIPEGEEVAVSITASEDKDCEHVLSKEPFLFDAMSWSQVMCMPVKCTETTESFSFFIFLNLAHATDNVNVTLHPKKALVKITGGTTATIDFRVDQDNNSTEPPRDTTEPPRDTTEPPRDTTEPPRDTTEPPRNATEPPRNATEPPQDTTKPPQNTTEPTPQGTTNPADPTDHKPTSHEEDGTEATTTTGGGEELTGEEEADPTDHKPTSHEEDSTEAPTTTGGGEELTGEEEEDLDWIFVGSVLGASVLVVFTVSTVVAIILRRRSKRSKQQLAAGEFFDSGLTIQNKNVAPHFEDDYPKVNTDTDAEIDVKLAAVKPESPPNVVDSESSDNEEDEDKSG